MTLLIPGVLMLLFKLFLVGRTGLLSIACAWLGAVYWRARKLFDEAKENEVDDSLV